MYRKDFIGIDAIFIDDNIPCIIAHGNHTVSFQHTLFLNIKYCLINIFATAIKFRSMHMNYQWFSRHFFSGNAGRISQPVVSMNHIKMLLLCNNGRYQCIAGNLLKNRFPVFPGECKLLRKDRFRNFFFPQTFFLKKLLVCFRRKIRH